MSVKDDSIYIDYMIDCIDRIDEYTQTGREGFMSSSLIQDAVIRNLQTLSESSQRLSDSFKDQQLSIPWRDIAGFRNILVHDYLGLDLEVIWSVVEIDLPGIREALNHSSDS